MSVLRTAGFRPLGGAILPRSGVRDILSLCGLAGAGKTGEGIAQSESRQPLRTGDQRRPHQAGGSGRCRTDSKCFVSWPLWRLSLSAAPKGRLVSVCQRSQSISNLLRGAS